MSNPNPVQTKEFKEQINRPVDDITEPFHPKVFGIKLPLSAAEKMLAMPTKQRTALMRRAVMEALEHEE
jgi:hypothetical protein